MPLSGDAPLHLVAPDGPLAVAVSGGGDSMALLDLAIRSRPGVRAVTVNHGLRPEAAAEAATVAAFCAARGIPHATLHWTGPAATGNLMDQARNARARLIGAWAVGQGVSHVLLGHTQDDVAETFVMNLARAAGIDGLAGLRAAWQDQGVTWHRPLLGETRASLRAYLDARGIAWTDDPSNTDDRFTRARVRKTLAALHPLGLTPAALAASAARLALVRQALDEATASAAAQITTAAGAAMVRRDALMSHPVETQRRLLIALIRWIATARHPPREAQLRTLTDALAKGRDATLAGVRFRQRDSRVTVSREPRAVRSGDLWDNRWHVTGPGGAEVRAVGAALKHVPGWRALNLPRQVLEVTPGLWQGDRLVAAPAAGWPQGWTAEIAVTLAATIKAH